MLIFFPWPLWKSRWIKRQNCDKYRNKCSKYSTNVLGTQLVTGGFLGCSPRLRATWSLRVLCAERNSHLWTLAPSQQLVCRWTVVRLFYHLLDLNSVHPKTDQDFNALNNLNMKCISLYAGSKKKMRREKYAISRTHEPVFPFSVSILRPFNFWNQLSRPYHFHTQLMTPRRSRAPLAEQQ